MKVALIGAGSAVFAHHVITDILAIDGLDAGIFALVDPNTERLELTHAVAEQIIQSTGKTWTVQTSTDRRSVLPNCDYVINMIEVGGPENATRRLCHSLEIRRGSMYCGYDWAG